MQAVLENQESRMYSTSILIVFEGDDQALEQAIAEASRVDFDTTKKDEEGPKMCAAKLIDFAHASWTPGQGPDENTLHGVRSVKAILEAMLAET